MEIWPCGNTNPIKAKLDPREACLSKALPCDVASLLKLVGSFQNLSCVSQIEMMMMILYIYIYIAAEKIKRPLQNSVSLVLLFIAKEQRGWTHA
ncbi:hypothetical protein J4Q44_G00341550 [Coregonus suidteri]|uniref:Uncharacterized protein n=1 Tax=Coregonus suidteri TaxID=861788 RepID=A0AAN8KSZ1_9TELE